MCNCSQHRKVLKLSQEQITVYCGANALEGKISAVCLHLKLAAQYESNISDMYEDS